MANMREAIIDYFKVKDEIKETVDKVINKSISLKDVERSGNEHYCRIEKMVTVLEKKKEYDDEKLKYEAATEDYIKGKKTLKQIQDNYKICIPTFYKEMKKRAKLGKKYQYDRPIKKGPVSLTYQNEKSLLTYLDGLVNGFKQGEEEYPKECCICRVCIMATIPTAAYKHAKQHRMKYYKDWDGPKRADFYWLMEFDMRHDVSDYFKCTLDCSLKQKSNW